MTTVQLSSITKTYQGSDFAVRNFDLTIPSGKITALLGPSGSGKSTLLKLIAGLLTPDSGDITFDDVSVISTPAESRGAVMAFQNNLVFPWMSVGENVAFGLKMRGVPKKQRQQQAAEMLELVQLGGFNNRKPTELSGGQQQRVSLARALVTQPKVLLLDEPLSNLDAHLRDEMRTLIQGLQHKFEITTIVVTHDQEEAVILADQIALLFDGELHQLGQPSTFYQQPASRRIAEFFGGTNFIPGTLIGTDFRTIYGDFTVREPRTGVSHFTIRPERIQVAQALSANCLMATLVESTFMGTHYRHQWQVETLALVSTSVAPLTLAVGEETLLYFPSDALTCF